jgi:hypothetical protein
MTSPACRTKSADIPKGEIPPGHVLDGRGVWVRPERLTEVDALRDQAVRALVARCEAASRGLAELKAALFADLAAHVQLVGEAHGVRLTGRSGNVVLISTDGLMRVERILAPRMRVGVDVLAAEEIVGRMLTDLLRDADPTVRALVDGMFARDRLGRIAPSRLLEFIRLDLDDPRWRRAQAAVRHALESDGEALYFRAYTRANVYQPWEPIPLDFSRIPFAAEQEGARV